MGFVLELGSERDMGRHHLAGICGIPAYAHYTRMARPSCSVLCNPWFRGGHVHVFWRDLPASRTARLRMSFRAQADLLRRRGLETGPASKSVRRGELSERTGAETVD